MKSYNNEIRTAEYINKLCDFVSKNYDVQITDFQPAKRGFYGETWKVITLDQTFFLKIDYSKNHKDLYAKSFSTIEYLNNEGIDFISQISINCGVGYAHDHRFLSIKFIDYGDVADG